MPSVSRETSRDARQHSFSESGRHSLVPMWDSSDPERAPPPLPLNPGKDAGSSSPVKANVSENVAAAARALVERARESMHGAYATNASPERSPDKSLVRTPQHKRLQSLQHVSFRDVRPTVEIPSELSSRASTPSLVKDFFPPSSPESNRSRSATPTATSRELRNRPIIEGTPPSATMLALQSMQLKDSDVPLGDITNSASRPVHSSDNLHHQIQNITAIANHLQQEMAALSRRSKDNATDLISLKEATNKRDEDIRKALRELVNNVRDRDTLLSPPRQDGSRVSSAMGHSHYCGSPTFTKCVQFPHEEEHDRGRSPAPHSLSSTASMTMLEKIVRDMATKDSHEKLSTSLTSLLEKSSNLSKETTKKLEDLVEKLREKEQNLALVLHEPRRRESSAHQDDHESRNLVLHGPAKPKAAAVAPATAFVSDEMRQMLQRIKDGISQAGGMTSEVKTLVRELRGEVLGMGRELGRKVEQQGAQSGKGLADKVKLEEIIQDGLAELRDQMEHVIQVRRRESIGSAMSRNTIDSMEVAEAVKHALAQYDINVGGNKSAESPLNRDAILSAVREAYEEYKPEIELQQFGLERDEILQCLKEGLEDYQSGKSTEQTSISREEILETIHGAIQQFQPPAPANDAAEIKEEVMAAVRECLESTETQRGWKPGDMTRGDVMDAVRDGLGEHKKSNAREIEINSEDLFQAVRAGLELTHVPYGQQVIESLREIIDGMKVEFQQYSAANGRDTEQVLDAMRDGLESLRSEVESYVDRAQDVTGKDEIIDALKRGFAGLQDNVPSGSQSDLLAYIKAEFESLHDIIGADRGAGHSSHKEDIIKAIMGGFSQMNNNGTSRGLEEPSDELLDAFKAEFEQLQSNLMHCSASHKDEILEGLQDSFASSARLAGATNRDEVLEAVREEISSLRDSMQAPVLHSGNSDSNTVELIRSTMEDIRVQLSADHSEASKESLGHIREELENLRAAIGGSLMLNSGGADKDELAEIVRRTLQESSLDQSQLHVVREELEKLRESLTNSLVPAGPSSEGLHQTLESLRHDIGKLADKPVDMTVSYEILDALKSGLDTVRADLEQLKSRTEDQMVLADRAASTATSGTNQLGKADIERLEVMLAQLQIKVEAMDQNFQNVPLTSGATKDDIAPVESMLRDLQTAVAGIAVRESSLGSKEDTDAIETLLHNTKVKIDEHVLPALDAVVKQDQIETLETFVKLTQENVDTLMGKIDTNGASKDDVAAIAHMVDEATTSINEIKNSVDGVKDGVKDGFKDGVTKGDVDLVGVMCMEIKNKLNDMSEETSMPSRSDIDHLGVLLTEFRQSHDKLRERYEGDIEITAKAFDDRKEESAQILERIETLRSSLEDANEEMRQRIKKGNSDVRALDEILLGIEDKIDSSKSSADLRVEMDKAHAMLETIRGEQGDQATSVLERSDDNRVAIIAELTAKLDEYSKTILARYELQQSATDETARLFSERATQQEEVLASNKAVAEDLKVSIDTLGATVTGIEPALKEATDKMSDDAKTVFSRVDEVQARLEETYLDGKTEHQLTRDELIKSLAAIGELRTEVAGQHPESLGLLKALLVIAEQHFEMARGFKENMEGSSDNIKAHFSEEIKRMPVPQIEAPPQTERYDDTALHSKLDRMLSRDDSKLHSKLDDLLRHSTEEQQQQQRETPEQTEKLDAIHSHVMSTASEVSGLVALQTRLLEARHETKEQEAREAEAALEKALTEKQSLEADIAALRKTKESLGQNVDQLKTQKEQAISERMKLSAEVSSLETALAIRREELHEMDARADALERRIIDGVMDHSRALLLTKQGPKSVNMNLKRVASNQSAVSAATTTPTMVNSYVNMTLGKPNANVYRSKTSATPSSRRIASLNQITGNSPGSTKGLAPLPKAGQGLLNLKRSQSVRNQALRKSSWAPGVGSFDKENEFVSEDSEAEAEAEYLSQADSRPDARLDSRLDSRFDAASRRTSLNGGSEYTASSDYTYGTGSYMTGSEVDRRSSVGSTIRSSIRPSSSLEPAIHEQSDDEEHEEEEEEEEEEEQEEEEVDRRQSTGSVIRADNDQAMVLAGHETFKPPPRIHTDGYDSGLGSDLPTAAAMSVSDGGHRDYFPAIKEEYVD